MQSCLMIVKVYLWQPVRGYIQLQEHVVMGVVDDRDIVVVQAPDTWHI